MIKSKVSGYFIATFLSVMIFTGCSKTATYNDNLGSIKEIDEKKDNLFKDDNDLPESIIGTFGFKNSLFLENENNVVKTTFHFEMKPAGWDMGILLFVDGYLQPFSLGGQKEENFPITKVESEMDKSAEFELVSGVEGENVRIDALSLLHPELQIKKEKVTAGLSFSTSSPLPAATICSKTVLHEKGSEQYEYKEIPQEIKDQKIITKNDGTVENQLHNSSYIAFYKEEVEAQWIEIKDGILSCELYACGDVYEENNFYVFLDNKLLHAFDGKDFCTVNVNADRMTVMKIQADVSDMNIKEYTQMFAVKVPVGKYKDEDIYVKRSKVAFIHNQKD